MHKTRRFRYWPLGAALAGVVYACSGSPDVIVRSDDDGAGADDGQGGSSGSGRGGASNGGTVIGTGKGGKGGTGSGKGGSQTGGDAGDDGTGGIRDAGLPDVGFSYDASSGGEGGACAVVTGEATEVKRPMDIIVSIDNSGSMAGEIQAVVARINGDFAGIIAASGIDYRVIMVSRYGHLNYAPDPTNFSVCVGPPLGNAACPGNSAPQLVNTSRFFHHSTDIGSNNMWCRLLNSYTASDEIPNTRSGWTALAPNGWRNWLRPNAFKVFIGITDDNPSTSGSQGCNGTTHPNDPGGLANTQAGAETFDRALRQLGPAQFGAYDADDPDQDRNYRWYSIVGMSPKASPNQTVPYDPSEAIVTSVCQGPVGGSGGDDDGVGAGQGYQHLSRMTGGLRYSNCLNDDFDAIFNAIAQGVIDGARAACEYAVPPNDNGIIDPAQTRVSYVPGGTGTPVDLGRVAADTACTSGQQYYFNQALDRIFLCPDACTTVQADPAAKIAIDFGCLGS